jgi:SAM-dependent methyltransferase
VPSTAELYDWELRWVHGRSDEDVGFYRSLAAAVGGPVLELACGTGRVATRLGGPSRLVVGLDVDHDMVRAASARGVAAVRGDMRLFGFGCRFGLVAVPDNSLQLLSFEDAAECLGCAALHLRPGGLIAFEATDFGAEVDVEPEVLASAEGITLTGGLEVDGDWLRYRRRFDFADGAPAVSSTITLRRSGAASAEALVAAAGLRLVSSEWAGLGLRVVATTTIPA